MTEAELLGPRAYGAALGRAWLKSAPLDFQVNEVLDIPFTGEGEHSWLYIEKQQLNTEQVAKRLAEFAQVPVRQVSYAGLKDKQAITRQWFSLQLPGKQSPDFTQLNSEQLKVLQQARHQRKLQRGSHKANQFVITLRQLALDVAPEELEQRLAQISQQGVPNYFGPQRFGREGFNLAFARQFAASHSLPDKRNVRSRLLSTARSFLFNQILAQRVTSGEWNQLISGDILSFTDSASFFPAAEMKADDLRFAQLDTHPTGALWGKGELVSSAQAAAYEHSVAEQEADLASWLAAAGLKQERRNLRLPVKQLTVKWLDTDALQLAFQLPVGCYATVVLRELFELTTAVSE